MARALNDSAANIVRSRSLHSPADNSSARSSERIELPDSCGNTLWAEVLPLLDLVDVTSVDVPELRRRAVVLPVLIGERDHIGQGRRAYPGLDRDDP